MNVIEGIILIIIGIIGVSFPEKVETFGDKWKYDGDIEPSKMNLLFTVILSIAMIIIGIGIIILGFYRKLN